MSSDEQKKKAAEGLAADIATKAEPGFREALEKQAREGGHLRKGESFSSETAHRLAAETARQNDARSRR